MFEHRSEPLLPPARFVLRMTRFLAIGALVDALVVAVGAIGFHATAGLAWSDALVDAAMVVTGNGPQHVHPAGAGKAFLSLYALAGGTCYVVVVALVLAPAIHRLMHGLHLREPDDAGEGEAPGAVAEIPP